MSVLDIDKVLDELRRGRMDARTARTLLSLDAIESVGGFAKVDVARRRRTGTPEVILAETKTLAETKAIAKKMLEKSGVAIVSRLGVRDRAKLAAFLRKQGATVSTARRTTTVLARSRRRGRIAGRVGIMAAGTSDIGIAEEARLMCESMDCECATAYDVGVAGLARVFPALEAMAKFGADALVVVAGMEGALPTVVASLTDVPVVGVPTSVGYGYARRGLAALASMLQSCAPGLVVVNIDNGIGGGAAAARIARRAR